MTFLNPQPAMNDPVSEDPYVDLASSTVRFWVVVDGRRFAASVRTSALHYCYRPDATADQPLETFAMHAAEIESVVHRRIAEGAREPVMLREFDLRVGGARKAP